MERSHIIIRGFCREIYIFDHPDSEWNIWEFITVSTRRPGRKVHMNLKKGNGDCFGESVCYFAAYPENRNGVKDEMAFQKHTCV